MSSAVWIPHGPHFSSEMCVSRRRSCLLVTAVCFICERLVMVTMEIVNIRPRHYRYHTARGRSKQTHDILQTVIHFQKLLFFRSTFFINVFTWVWQAFGVPRVTNLQRYWKVNWISHFVLINRFCSGIQCLTIALKYLIYRCLGFQIDLY